MKGLLGGKGVLFDIDDAIAEQYGFHYEPGWVGIITRLRAPGAEYESGARIAKSVYEAGDTQLVGALGTVLGSFRAPGNERCGYFVEWDALPRHSIFVLDWKIERAP